MKILLSGVETNNKGAELMLYAILQEIERKFPEATVYLSLYRIRQGLQYVKTSVDFRVWPLENLVTNLKIKKIFKIFHLPYSLLPHIYAIRNVDYHLDGSGFAYSDQFKITDSKINNEEELLKFLSSRGCKNVFLPQAFGPIEKTLTKKMLTIISKYASIIMPREKVSYKYLDDSRCVDMTKVKLYTDFTSLVEGIFPTKFEHLRNGICIIPNSQMINKGTITMENYLDFLKAIVTNSKQSGKKVYLLNHEGEKDGLLCYQIKNVLSDNIEIVLGLNALEVKGLIASAYLVITSRFHGLASSLNSCVPALATSWSHKYEELFRDYDLDNYVLPLDNQQKSLDLINNLLDDKENIRIREQLKLRVPQIKKTTREMWNTIWKL